MKPTIFQSGWEKIKNNSVSWGSLLLFTGGLITLVILMKLMPYSAVSP